jgi:hypothetical protein
VLEHQPAAGWMERAFAEKDATARLEALLALARQSAPCPYHTEKAAKPDPRTGIAPTTAEPTPAQAALRDRLLAALRGMDFAKLTKNQQLAHARLAQIVLHRYGKPDAAGIAAITGQYDAAYPAADFELNWILTGTSRSCSRRRSPPRAWPSWPTPAARSPMEYMRSLRMLKAGWTPAPARGPAQLVRQGRQLPRRLELRQVHRIHPQRRPATFTPRSSPVTRSSSPWPRTRP